MDQDVVNRTSERAGPRFYSRCLDRDIILSLALLLYTIFSSDMWNNLMGDLMVYLSYVQYVHSHYWYRMIY
jgi:hypothetical protein